MKKIAIIVQRYGEEVNGGAEYHARVLAEKLAEKYAVSVLTTTALDYTCWENYFPEGKSRVNGIEVLRFPTLQPISRKRFRRARRAILKRKKYFKILKFLGIFDFCDKKWNITKYSPKDIETWLIGQGPYCPTLIDYLSENRDNYDVFIFFTYLYYPTVVGMPMVGEKTIFIPTAHDEPPLYSPPYRKLFAVPRFIMYNTPSEKSLVENYFSEHCENNDVAGIGIDAFSLEEEYKPCEALDFDFSYFIYIGRIEGNKGCGELVEYFNKFSIQYPDIKLVMVGKNMMNLKPTDNIILTGFISEEDKYYLLKNSLGLVLPSKYESLSLVTLEAMISGKIPIVNGNCEVLKEHILNSKAGYYFEDYASFSKVLEEVVMLSNDEKEEISKRAQIYVQNHYTWDKILEKFDKAIDLISKI